MDRYLLATLLPSEIIAELNLSWTGIDRGTLGDGSEVTFEVYAAKVIWDGEYRDILNQSVLDLAEQFLGRSSLPAKADVDAVHIAAATVHGGSL